MAEKKGKKKATRATSNVFSMFDQKQVQEFKEAFNLMDQDRDGTISIDDLKEVYSSLGKAPKDAELKAMIDEAKGAVNFTMLLTLFGERLNGTDEENVILNGWKNFDKEGTGLISQHSLREILTGEGRKEDRLSDIEFTQMLEGAPLDPKGNLDYAAFTRQIKRGKEDDIAMQKINTKRQLVSDRLQPHLPVNTIRETENTIHHKRVNQISQSAPNRFHKLAAEKQQQLPLRRFQTDLDTSRSLSSCPTYSSLSRHSPETRNCATQITTLTPLESVDDNQYLSSDYPVPVKNNPVLLIDEDPIEEIEVMPISSGAGNYPYDYPTTRTKRIVQPQIVTRANQFRGKKEYGFNSQFGPKSTSKSPPQRPTAVKQPSPRSDIYPLPAKRYQVNPRTSKDDFMQPDFRRAPPKERFARNSSPMFNNRYAGSMRRNEPPRIMHNNRKSSFDEDARHKPLRFISKHNRSHRSSSPPATNNRRPISLPRNALQKQRRIHETNDNYDVERRKQPVRYVHDDYRSDISYERRRRPQRMVRVLRETPYRDNDYYYDDEYDDAYYDESPRRPSVMRRAPPKEYVFLDETPKPVRRSRSRRSEIVYDDDDRPIQYEDEIVYVDEHGNEVEFVDERSSSKRYVEYVDDDDDYDDEEQRHTTRHPPKTRAVYVGDDSSSNRNEDKSKSKPKPKPKSKQPASTRIVYE
ncbi:unnamed protein product [Rotaria socialis]|uniref:EF-hand domain-containing protein n=4 Tax=Rotaria socialis TaxID=392032 RepID=A0A820W1T6_9BILA|nr:unnamed protein product [Rotaria socialis]CAF4510810.1 unnamed protein product [Rotaria socialis]